MEIIADKNTYMVNNFKFIFIGLLALSIQVFASETDLYQEMLEKHSSSGHMTPEELKEQKFKYTNQKRWQNDFSKKVRSVASTIDESRDVIKLTNEEIEISVK